MKLKILGAIAISIIGISLLVFDFSRCPDSYEDHVLKEMKGVESDKAATLIAKCCRSKIPEK
ncbi:MAG: hypothetical protein WBB19_19935 [Desulforhopalus sp.]